MRKYIKKTAAALSAAAFAAASMCSYAAVISAEVIDFAADYNSSELNVKPLLTTPQLDVLETGCGDEIVAAVYYEAPEKLLSDENELPSSFDMRDEGTISPVKSQGGYGTCWSFAGTACAESSLIGADPSIDLSELYSAYYSFYGDDQPKTSSGTDTYSILAEGANRDVLVNAWSQWHGPVNESVLPYDNADWIDTGTFAADNVNRADYHLENAYMFSYEKDGSNREAVNQMIKEYVYSGKPVDMSFYWDQSKAYNSRTYAAYSDVIPKKSNHSVVIAGWDDTFSASNFNAYNGKKPEHDGAWLVKNSWGTGLGDTGYVWVSYDESSLCDFTVMDVSYADNYTTNYGYDSFVPSPSLSAADVETEEMVPSYMANIFTAERTEQIEAVSTYVSYVGTEYEITVYTDLADEADPTSGTASSVTKGTVEAGGYLTLELDDNVVITEGEKFSVVIKMQSDKTNYVIPVETALFITDSTTGEKLPVGGYSTSEQLVANTGKNESFYSEDGTEWTDACENGFTYTDEEKAEVFDSIFEQMAEDGYTEDEINSAKERYEALFAKGDLSVQLGNISIKAFANPVNTVDFSHESGNVPLDERVELSAKGAPVIYSVNGGMPQIYTEPIEITEEMTIMATTDMENVTVRTYKPAKAEFVAIGYTESTASQSAVLKYAERIDSSTYRINISETGTKVRLYPETGADILLDGKNIAKNKLMTSVYPAFGKTVMTFELTDENKLDNTVTLIINRSPVGINTQDETIKINNGVTVTAPDGRELASGDSVSDYAGQMLTVTANSETMEYPVPERAELPQLATDYHAECLRGIPSEYMETLEMSFGEGYVPAANRLQPDGSIIIIPGEEFSLRIAADENHFASTEYAYSIPDTPPAPNRIPPYTAKDGVVTFADGEYVFTQAGFVLNDEQFAVFASALGYEADRLAELMMKTFGFTKKEQIYSLLLADWSGKSFHADENNAVGVWIRKEATDTQFASKAVYFTVIAEDFMYGDLDGDGKISPNDSTITLMHYTTVAAGGPDLLTAQQKKAADFNGDDVINPVDATEMLWAYVKEASGR